MVLTKHLYRYDEVVSALLYCLKQKRPESQFWLYELEESGFQEDAKVILLIGWIMRIGLSRISWLQHWASTSNIQTSRILLCDELLSLTECDASIWWLLWHGATSEKRPTITLETAILEKNLTVAWWYLSKFDSNTFWVTIREMSVQTPLVPLLNSLQYELGSYEIFGRCTAVAVFLTYKNISTTSWKEINISISKYTHQMYTHMNSFLIPSIKSYRLYSIPWGCLFGMTKRGFGRSTISELHNLEENLQKSPSWIHTMKQYQINNNWIDEQSRELFYEHHFPYQNGDIPDEWSLSEKQKSHGDIIPLVGEPLFTRWWRNWTIQERLYVHGQDASDIQVWMNETLINFHETVFVTLQKLYEEQYMLNMTRKFENMIV